MCRGMFVSEIDVTNASCNGMLDEEVCVVLPLGVPCKVSECHKLNKAIYGLMKAILRWHTKLIIDYQLMGFKSLPSAPCVFPLRCKS